MKSLTIVVTELHGGLGNQLFQYACGRAFAEQAGAQLYLGVDQFNCYKLRKYELHQFNIFEKFSTIEMLKKFGIQGRFKKRNILEKITYRFFHNRVEPGWLELKEKQPFVYEPLNILSNTKAVYLSGYWQAPQYFESIQEKIRFEFQLKNEPQGLNRQWLNEFNKKNTIAIHIRRGDYVSNPATKEVHGVCSLEYYQNAIAKMIAELNPDQFIVFSDDIPWCKQNLRFSHSVLYADHNTSDNACEDLRLMQACSGHIIANSSFSWWGAWLAGKKSKLVIAPKQWISWQKGKKFDIYLKDWVLLNN